MACLISGECRSAGVYAPMIQGSKRQVCFHQIADRDRSTTGARFADLLEKRAVSFDGTCDSALRKIFLGITDFMLSVLGHGHEHRPRLDPYMELAIIAVVRGMVIEGLNHYPADWKVSQQTLANTVSWGLYGAARDWIDSPERTPAEQIANAVTGLLAPLVHPG